MMKQSNKTSLSPRVLCRQRGATLLIAMIFLVLMMLIVASAIKVTNVNTKVVGNMQIERESEAAAQQAIETAISADFTLMPTQTTVPVDINSSGQTATTYQVDVPAPVCVSVKPIKQSELDPSNPADQGCTVSGAAQNTGVVGGGGNGNSLCYNSNWEISATAKAPGVATTNTQTTLGVARRVSLGAAC